MLSSFVYGVMVGAQNYPPYKLLLSSYRQLIAKEYDKIDPFYKETDVSSLISIKDGIDVIKKREKLIQYIWRNRGFPYAKMPDKVENGITDDRYSDLGNLKRIDKILVSMDYGVNSIIYHFHPAQNNNRLVIYHEGHERKHRGDFIAGKNTIRFFLNKGYSVMAFSMPLLGMNNQPVVDLKSVGRVKLTSHDLFKFLESNEINPVKFFIEPIAISLNYAQKNFSFSSISMVGISGGGWATTLYPAIDTRISKSYPVAGSLPLYLTFNSLGHYEWSLPELNHVSNYLELYILASYGNGRKSLQVLNKYDPCCFSGIGYQTYENKVKASVSRLGKGAFDIYLDNTHKDHKISDNALNIIINDLEM